MLTFCVELGIISIVKFNIQIFVWGRKGFDGDFEHGGASSGGHHLKSLKLNIKANDNLAYAA